MDLIRPALVALVTWFAVSALAGVVYVTSSMTAAPMSVAAHIVWIVALQAAVGLATSGGAALAHGRAGRADEKRHAAVSLGSVVVLAVVLGAADVLTGTPAGPAAVALVAQLAGGVAGWLLVSRVVRRTEWRSATKHGVYF